MKLDELCVIQMLKDYKYIKDENDIAELKIDEGNVYLKLKDSLEYASMDIDVSECEYFKRNRGFNCFKDLNCTDKECDDCYYRQLKRLEEQENEKTTQTENS